MPSPPLAEQQPHIHTEHGVERPDPYYWLRDRKNPKVIAYLEAENAYVAKQTRGDKAEYVWLLCHHDTLRCWGPMRFDCVVMVACRRAAMYKVVHKGL